MDYMECVENFLFAVKTNNSKIFEETIYPEKIEQIRSLAGYLGGAGLVSVLSTDEYMTITVDSIGENIMDIFGDDAFETIQYTCNYEDNDKAVVTLSNKLSSEAIVCKKANGEYKIFDFGVLDS
jgi:hypothetical protein